jgi:hypothetical protein
VKLVCFCGLATPAELDAKYITELINTGFYACVKAMLNANRLLYFKLEE